MNDLFMLVYGASVLPILVFDFDGTVCLGDGPVWAYADEALRGVDDEVAAHLAAQLRRHLDGAPGHPDGHPDGYAAVAALAGPYVSPEDLQKAYLASREALAGAVLDITAPGGRRAVRPGGARRPGPGGGPTPPPRRVPAPGPGGVRTPGRTASGSGWRSARSRASVPGRWTGSSLPGPSRP